MKKPITIAVIEFPGTNCERETKEALRRSGMVPVSHRWNEDAALLSDYDGFIIAGGFSYEDRSRSGVIAAKDPIIDYLKAENEKGKPILGICNGAQILVETGIVPGIAGYRLGAALAPNRRVSNGTLQGTGFYNSWVHIVADTRQTDSAFTSACDASAMRVPAAHAEGRFLFAPDVLDELQRRNLICFRYSDAAGTLSPEFPVNPNGSQDNCAGIMNASGNALALMPHPERTSAGDGIFLSMRDYIEQHSFPLQSKPVFLSPDLAVKDEQLAPYQPENESLELTVALLITDNVAASVQRVLRNNGLQARVERMTHWEIVFTHAVESTERQSLLERIISSGELLNTNKEVITQLPQQKQPARSYLTHSRDDAVAEHARYTLTHWFGIPNIARIKHGTLWRITPLDDTQADDIYRAVESSHLLIHPLIHRSMLYGET
ncbi:MAG: phosphoribosylformylglycinamidine synthase I [Spirochaetota bacterium]